MDLLQEGDTGLRKLSTRHINEKTYTEIDNSINATALLCQNYSLQPDFASYFSALQNYAIGLWVSGFVILLTICLLYLLSVRAVWRHSRSSTTYATIVLSVYPVVAASAYVATIVPRATLLCEAIAQQVVMLALYNFFCMVIIDCGGVDRLISRAGDCRLETRVLPCCCWPCCIIPRPQLQRRNLLRIRYLVLQMPVIQALVYISILIIWAEDMILFTHNFMYFQPLVATSILTGLWGIMMCVRAAENAGAKPRPRLLALQLVLFIVKLQYGIVRALPTMFRMPCVMALHPAVFVNLLQNSTTIVEMLLLSVLAWKLYSVPPTKAIDKVHHAVITTVEENSLDFKSLGIEALNSKSLM